MAVTIDDIQKKQFTTRSHWYDRFEVDTFLEDIMMQMESEEKEIDELREKCSSLYEVINVYKQTEDTMKEVLMLAKEKRDDILKSANAQKEEIISAAKEEANAILEEAKAKSEEMLSGIDVNINQMKEQAEALKNEYNTFRSKFEDMLKSQLEYLDNEKPYIEGNK